MKTIAIWVIALVVGAIVYQLILNDFTWVNTLKAVAGAGVLLFLVSLFENYNQSE